VNAEITGEIPHIDGGQSPDTEIPASHFRQGYAGTFRPTFTPRRWLIGTCSSNRAARTSSAAAPTVRRPESCVLLS
jgi:hypothetical protein